MSKARDLADLISSGSVETGEITSLDAAKLTGTIDNARIALDAAEIPNLDASKITSGTIDNARISLDAAEIPNISASKITSGTIATARLGSGTASSSTFLRGDSTYAVISDNSIPFSIALG